MPPKLTTGGAIESSAAAESAIPLSDVDALPTLVVITRVAPFKPLEVGLKETGSVVVAPLASVSAPGEPALNSVEETVIFSNRERLGGSYGDRNIRGRAHGRTLLIAQALR